MDETEASRQLQVDLETFLRQGRGRCHGCGAHPERQRGHIEGCPTTTGKN